MAGSTGKKPNNRKRNAKKDEAKAAVKIKKDGIEKKKQEGKDRKAVLMAKKKKIQDNNKDKQDSEEVKAQISQLERDL